MEYLPFASTEDGPLAERMRPREIDEIVGQESILGPRGALRTLIERGDYRSLLFWGPPGSGKTTVGRIISRLFQAKFVHLSAALCGVKEVKEVLQRSRQSLRLGGKRDLLFLDEIHRFTRNQQDVLLSYIEEGSIIFIGATTENPSFTLNAALLSRCQLFLFSPLSPEDISNIVQRAAEDEKGLGNRFQITAQAERAIIALSDGDARRALSTLELVTSIATNKKIDVDLVERAVQRKGLNYDRSGEQHYDLISAFHKSIRNSDPDATLYWLARMIEAGEDPRFIARRLIRIASEDVGLADSQALQVTLAARQTVDAIGLPECDLALAQAAVYLSCAPKSNALYIGLGKAREDVRNLPLEQVPLHLRNAPTDMMKDLSYGKEYKYAHNYDEGVAKMDCLPPSLLGKTYYCPTNRGSEKNIREILQRIKALHKQKETKQPRGDS
jgi:putative ATPase